MSRKKVGGRHSVRVIAAAATAVVVPAGHEFAHAQSPNVASNDRKTTVSLEGGLLFSDFSPSTLFPGGVPGASKGLFPTTDGSLTPKKNIGGYGAISLGQDINQDFDWRISAAFNAFRTNSRSATTTSTSETHSVTESETFKFLTLDFDIGRKWENGNLKFRTFAGLRGLRTIDDFSILDTDTASIIKLGTITSTTSMGGNSHFTGVGPRIGLDFFYGSTFGIAGSASAAAIWGVYDSSFSLTSTTPGIGGSSQNRSDWVENVSGSLGFQWEFAPMNYVVLGYKADMWWNIRDDFGFTGIDFNRDKDIFSHGPFLRVTIRR